MTAGILETSSRVVPTNTMIAINRSIVACGVPLLRQTRDLGRVRWSRSDRHASVDHVLRHELVRGLRAAATLIEKMRDVDVSGLTDDEHIAIDAVLTTIIRMRSAFGRA
jgi:hypothetical protein